MAHLARPVEAFPAEIGVFPLEGALLLPGGRLPLNVFEPRYLALTDAALGAGRMFGMIQPDPHQPERDEGPALYSIGCLARITSFSETDDGRYLLTLAGVIRFAVDGELAPLNGFRRVRALYDRFGPDIDADAAMGGFDRDTLLADLRLYFRRRGIETNWDAIQQISDAHLVTTLAMACPFEPSEQQALLEAPTPEDRAAALLALLRMGSHDLTESGAGTPS